jgi:predicted metal-dependent phosphoesterase TrpH
MKKIDLHIHTIPTFSDADFEFSLETLKSYVAATKIDAIAITNHDLFDRAQYSSINEALDIAVFPGIEVNLQTGHALIISYRPIVSAQHRIYS